MSEPTHDDQKRASMVAALKKAGIGEAYGDMGLTDLGEGGKELKTWLVSGQARFDRGQGADFRGGGVDGHKLFNMLGRSLLVMNMSVRMIPLTKLMREVRNADMREELEDVRCLLISGFDRGGECPFPKSDLYEVEDFLKDRFDNLRSTSVQRICTAPSGWWSPDIERFLAERNAVREMGQ